MAEAERVLGHSDLESLAERIRITTFRCGGDDPKYRDVQYKLHCFVRTCAGHMSLRVLGNGVECIITIEDNQIVANDDLPPIEGVNMLPYTGSRLFTKYVLEI